MERNRREGREVALFSKQGLALCGQVRRAGVQTQAWLGVSLVHMVTNTHLNTHMSMHILLLTQKDACLRMADMMFLIHSKIRYQYLTCSFLISFLRSASYFSFWLALAALCSCYFHTGNKTFNTIQALVINHTSAHTITMNE